MSVPLIEITRGSIVECIHRGDIAVVDSSGDLLYSVGDPHKVTYMRSAAKPIQAINVLLSGSAERFELTEEEIAVICSSHYAEPFHLNAVNSILNKIGLTAENILGGTVTSLNKRYALELAWNNTVLNPTYSDCSGKHSGMLAVCRHKNYSIEDYLDQSHPNQKKILKILSEICLISESEITVGVDGCSAPVHAMPIYNMALGYARFVSEKTLSEKYRIPAQTVFDAMNNFPLMISGTGGFCSDLIKNTNRKLIGKIGAEGVYCIGLKKEGIGIALKVESGSMEVIPPIVLQILLELNVLEPNELKNLNKYIIMDNLNDKNITVGKVKPIFEMNRK